jgi:HEAT repeat protein
MNTWKDDDPFVRLEATLALAAIGTDAVEPLVKALKDNSRYVRMGTAMALGHMGPRASGAEPALLQGLKDPDLPGVDYGPVR